MRDRDYCKECGSKLKRVRRTSWRKGYRYCPNGCRPKITENEVKL